MASDSLNSVNNPNTENAMNDLINDLVNDNLPTCFDDICRTMIRTMCRMDMQTLQALKMQAAKELQQAKLAKGCIDYAISIKKEHEDRAAEAEDANQPSLLD